jgi:hypothetical protein
LAREYVRRIGETLFGVPIVTVGTTVVNDKNNRSAHQLDIVTLGSGTGPQNRVVEAVGEAKLRELHNDDLGRLLRIRTLLSGANDAQIVLASASGFADDLVAQAAGRADIHLVGLKDIYSD